MVTGRVPHVQSPTTATSPGTPTLRPDRVARSRGIARPLELDEAIGPRCGWRGFASVVAGEFFFCLVPMDQERATPSPDDCGSTSASTNCVAIAASVAEPPARNISRPASEA